MVLTRFESVDPTAEQVAFLRAYLAPFRFQRKRCYWNAQRVVINDDSRRLTYCEGLARLGICNALHHGWMLLDGQVIVELTARRAGDDPPPACAVLKDRYVGRFPGDWQYYGTVIDTVTVAKAWISGDGGWHMLQGLPESLSNAGDLQAVCCGA